LCEREEREKEKRYNIFEISFSAKIFPEVTSIFPKFFRKMTNITLPLNEQFPSLVKFGYKSKFHFAVI